MMTLIISFSGITFVNMAQTLMVDFFPGEASSASGCVNLIRCLLCVVGLAVIDRMISAMGVGWAITVVAGIAGLSLAGMYIVFLYGLEWNSERMEKNDQRILFYLHNLSFTITIIPIILFLIVFFGIMYI